MKKELVLKKLILGKCFMKNKLFILLFGLIYCGFINGKVAIIDSGLDLSLIDTEKAYYNDFHKCPYVFNIVDKTNCETISNHNNHGTTVFRIIQNQSPKNHILFYEQSNFANNNNLDLVKYPTSLKYVYANKQVYEKIANNMAESIEYAIRYGSKIINISMASRALKSDYLNKVIRSNQNVLFIFAAGNDGHDLDIPYNRTYPCSYKYKNTICVGTKIKDKIANYSNYGDSVVDIYVEPPLDDGTSFSTASVTSEAMKYESMNTYDIKKILIKKYKK